MKGGGRRKSWLSDGTKVDGKEIRSNRARPPRQREYTSVFNNERGALAAKDFLAEHRFFKVPVRQRDGKATIVLV